MTDIEERDQNFRKIIEGYGIFENIFCDEHAETEFIEWLRRSGYFSAPASLKHHGAEEGGLYTHSVAVANILADLTKKNNLSWLRRESPWIVGLFHDVCKMDDYILVDDGHESTWKWNKNAVFTGHGDKSILMLAPYISLTEQEVICIRWHMGAFDDKENWARFTEAIHRCPTVLWTHTADMLATHDWRL